MSPARTTTIIVTYNSLDTISGALDGLRQCWEQGLTHVVVVDNDSRDGTPEFVSERHPWVKLIRSGGNLGFGRGNNLGFAACETEYVFFLNPDASIDPGSLRILVDFMDANPRAGVAAPAAVTPAGGRHNYSVVPKPWHIVVDAALNGRHRTGPRYLEPGAKPFRVEWVPGAALFFRSELFRKLGGFDARFFLYFEETDLLRRVVESGSEIWAVCEACIQHMCQGSTRKQGAHMFDHCIAEHYFRSRLYYFAKHHGRPTAFLAEGAELLFLALRAIPDVARNRHVRLFDRLKGPVFRMPEFR